MKRVTDGFINMQSETISHEENGDIMSQMLFVEWESGLEWKAVKSEEMHRDGNLMDVNRENNAVTARKYLEANTLTYHEWFDKYKREEYKVTLLDTEYASMPSRVSLTYDGETIGFVFIDGGIGTMVINTERGHEIVTEKMNHTFYLSSRAICEVQDDTFYLSSRAIGDVQDGQIVKGSRKDIEFNIINKKK